MTMCDGRDDVFGSGYGIQNTVTIDTDRHRERRKGQGGIPAGGDFHEEIQPEPLELFSRKTLAQQEGKENAFPSCPTASDAALYACKMKALSRWPCFQIASMDRRADVAAIRRRGTGEAAASPRIPLGQTRSPATRVRVWEEEQRSTVEEKSPRHFAALWG